MSIKIVTDSGSDISQAEALEKEITVLPLKTIIGDREYRDGIDISTTEFYERLIESDDIPKTSQISPYDYEAAFERELKDFDSVLCITISSKLSGCYQSACIAASEFDGRVTVVDSESVSLGLRCLVEYAVELLKSETDIKKAEEALNIQKKKLMVVALLDTLEYLKKGGRISAAAALAGNVLSIKPVIALRDGEIIMLGKARGSKNGNNLLTQCVKIRGPIDFKKPYCLAYSGLSDALLKKYIEDTGSFFNVDKENIPIHIIGSTIGTHSGPGAIAAAFFCLGE